MCTSSEECSINPRGKRGVCDVAKEVCVQCLADSDCTYNPKKSVCYNNKCNKPRNIPAPGNGTCTSSEECKVNSRGRLGVCDVSKEVCVQCLADSDCTFKPRKSVCDDNNKCIPIARANRIRGGRGGQRARGSLTCTSSDECNGNGKHRVCDMAKEVCVQCIADTDCTFNPKKSLCNNNKCIKPGPGNLTCTSSDECNFNTRGRLGVCDVNKEECVQCLSDTDCTFNPRKSVCNSNNRCMKPGQRPRGSPTCTSSDECNVRARGRLGVCDVSKEKCVQCLVDSDCTFNPRRSLCDNNMCVGCIGDSDCDDGFCSVRRCQAPLSTGATCITNAWCASGTCTDNICE